MSQTMDGDKIFDTWLDDMKVTAAKYRPDLNTFELTVLSPESFPLVMILNKRFFPDHPALKFLDEKVQIGEDVKVVLKTEKELEVLGWRSENERKRNPTAKLKFGAPKQKLLGGVWDAVVGIDDQMTPYLIVDGKFKFTPSEVKCLLRGSDLNTLKKPKSAAQTGYSGSYQYNLEQGQLLLPLRTYTNRDAINELITFLKKTNLV